MSGKISMSFGNGTNPLSVNQATQFFLGCTDALVEMGLYQYCKMVDLVEVIRIYPNSGLLTDKQIIVEVVVSWSDSKKIHESFIVLLGDDKTIRAFVKDEIVRITRKLAQELLRGLKDTTKAFEDRLSKNQT